MLDKRDAEKDQVTSRLSEKEDNIDLCFSFTFISCNFSVRAGNEDKLFSSLSGQGLRWMRRWAAWQKRLKRSPAASQLPRVLGAVASWQPWSQCQGKEMVSGLGGSSPEPTGTEGHGRMEACLPSGCSTPLLVLMLAGRSLLGQPARDSGVVPVLALTEMR